MPVIIVEMYAERPREKRAELAAKLTQATIDTLEVKPEQVRVIIHEISRENYAVAGTMAADREKQAT